MAPTLTIWLNHIDSHGGAPIPSSSGPRNLDSVITVG